MNILDKIKKRIATIEFAKNQKITEIQITREEREQLQDKIKEIDGVKLVVVDKLGEKTKQDCFAYKDKQCYALNDLYCKNKECRFYRNDVRVEEIESDIRKYAKYD